MAAPELCEGIVEVKADKLAWLLAALTLALNSSAVLLGLLNGYNPWSLLFLVTAVSAAIVGGVIGWRQPANRVGWIIAGFALCFTLGEFSRQYTVYAVFTQPGTLPFTPLMAWPVYWIWFPGLICLLVFLPLYFPSGRLVAPRWRIVVWLALLVTIVVSGLAAVTPGDVEIPAYPNPLGIEQTIGINLRDERIALVAVLLWLGLGTMAAASLVIRYRQARGAERQQIKWFTYAMALLIAFMIIHQLFLQTRLPEPLSTILLTLPLQGIWLAVAVAVLRYRLYDIDLIIRRTLVYSLLTGLLALFYFGSVILLQSLFTAITGEQSSIAIVLSTLAIAALFNPLRHRLQSIIDRRFYRQKYDAAQTLTTFAVTARNEVELDQLTAELLRVVQKTMQPKHSTLWLKTETTRQK